MKEICCICGKELPNRWAVAGCCKVKGCDEPFCVLHWRNGNHRCREHGWKEKGNRYEALGTRAPENGDLGSDAEEPKPEKIGLMKKLNPFMRTPNNQQRTADTLMTEPEETEMNEKKNNEFDLSQMPEKQGKKAMDEAIKVAKAAGTGVAGLVAKIQYARSPQAMQDTLNENLKKNTVRREEVSKKLAKTYNRIVALKKQYETAPPARKKTLQMELKALMGQYKSLEGEFKILLENEEVLSKVRGRFMETLAYDLRGIKEKHIDKVTDKIDDKAEEAEDVQDAMVDLDGAGRRKERDDGDFDFDSELAAFGDEEIGDAGFQSLEETIPDPEKTDDDPLQPIEPEKKKDGLAEPEE